MRVAVNGETRDVPTPCTITDLLQLLQLDATHLGIAVAVNRRVIPRSEWAATRLQEGDTIELVYARQGG